MKITIQIDDKNAEILRRIAEALNTTPEGFLQKATDFSTFLEKGISPFSPKAVMEVVRDYAEYFEKPELIDFVWKEICQNVWEEFKKFSHLTPPSLIKVSPSSEYVLEECYCKACNKFIGYLPQKGSLKQPPLYCSKNCILKDFDVEEGKYRKKE